MAASRKASRDASFSDVSQRTQGADGSPHWADSKTGQRVTQPAQPGRGQDVGDGPVGGWGGPGCPHEPQCGGEGSSAASTFQGALQSPCKETAAWCQRSQQRADMQESEGEGPGPGGSVRGCMAPQCCPDIAWPGHSPSVHRIPARRGDNASSPNLGRSASLPLLPESVHLDSSHPTLAVRLNLGSGRVGCTQWGCGHTRRTQGCVHLLEADSSSALLGGGAFSSCPSSRCAFKRPQPTLGPLPPCFSCQSLPLDRF